MLAGGANDREHAMSQSLNSAVAVVGIDIDKNSFHIAGLDQRGTIALRRPFSSLSVLHADDGAGPFLDYDGRNRAVVAGRKLIGQRPNVS
jgi:hypothetical protein